MIAVSKTTTFLCVFYLKAMRLSIFYQLSKQNNRILYYIKIVAFPMLTHNSMLQTILSSQSLAYDFVCIQQGL